MQLTTEKPDISYPCAWSYRVVGTDPAAMRQAIDAVVIVPHTVTESRVSSGGKYTSLSVDLTVETEVQRLGFFDGLAKHPAIRVVL